MIISNPFLFFKNGFVWLYSFFRLTIPSIYLAATNQSDYLCKMKSIHSSDFKIGLLGGGQLGRMMLQKAYDYNLHIAVLDPNPQAPCHQIANEFVVGNFKDFNTVYEFGKDKDVVTIEFEDVNSDALQALEDLGVKVFPQAKVLKTIQDKGLQKEFFTKIGVPTSPYFIAANKEEILAKATTYPLFQKLRTSGYDGYGVQKIKDVNDVENAMEGPSMCEVGVEMDKELSVIVARNESGEVKQFPVVELEFNPIANMVEFLFAPANITVDIEQQAQTIAAKIIAELNMVGLLAVEFFLSKTGELLVNEIAPRPHNSGHQSIEGNYTSQFDQHIRSILNLPLGNTAMVKPSVMVNLLGEEGYEGDAIYEGITNILDMDGVNVHLYGKAKTKSFRKMGHVTIVAETLSEAKTIAKKVKETIKIKA